MDIRDIYVSVCSDREKRERTKRRGKDNLFRRVGDRCLVKNWSSYY